MNEVQNTPQPQTDFDGSLEVLFDPDANRALLLDPGTPVEVRAGSRGRRFAFARAGLSVIAISGVCLLPPAAVADGVSASAPVVSSLCEITDKLDDGTASGVLADGTICVLPSPPSETSTGDSAGGPAQPAAPQGPAALAAATAQPPAAAHSAAVPPTAASTAAGTAAASTAAGTAAAAPATKPTSSSAVQRGASQTTTAPERKLTSRRRASAGKAGRRAQRRAATKLRHGVTSRAKRPESTTDVRKDVAISVEGPRKPVLYVSDEAVVPRFLIRLYREAGKRYDIPWPILAAINEIETDFGRNVAVSSAGARGWMQFMPDTWKAYGVDADRNGVKDPDNPRDAIFAAARYLDAAGGVANLRRAIFAYNHAGWYVDSVLLRAERIADQQGDRTRMLSKLFEAGGRRLEKQVLADRRITLYECGREDIEAHRIDRRVLILLRFLAWSGLHPTVSSLECGHGFYTKSGNVSHHSSGNAVDISAINGIPIMGHQGSGSVTEATIRELLTLRGAMRPDQIISLMTFERAENTFAMGDHADHIHVGFAPLEPASRGH